MAPIYPPTSEPTSSVSSPVTASIVPPIPVPTHGPGGSFSVLAKTRVAVPPLQALHLIQDTNSWKEWNSFCPHCVIEKGKGKLDGERVEGRREEEGWLESGSVATIDVYLNGDGLLEGRKRSRTQGVVITRVEDFDEECGEGQEGRDGRRKGYRIAWKSTGWAHWQMHSERVMEFVEIDMDGGVVGTDYSCWETFGGILAVAVKGTVGGQLVDRFGDYAKDVKTYLESGGV